jgi:hypothetical protein
MKISKPMDRKRNVFTSKLRTRPLPDSKSFSKSLSRQTKNESSELHDEWNDELVDFGNKKIK